jgi:hypothetical protein
MIFILHRVKKQTDFCYIARIDDGDSGQCHEHDLWMKRTEPPEEEQELRVDRWFYKNMIVLRDNPEQSGLYRTPLSITYLF